MVRFLGTSPRLPTKDLKRAVDFYVGVLGFEVANSWPGDAPTFAMVVRDDVMVQLSLAGPGEATGHVTLSLNVDDALAIHAAVKDKVAIEWGPEVYWYGRREFSFRDPDGYAIIISAETSDPVDCEDED